MVVIGFVVLWRGQNHSEAGVFCAAPTPVHAECDLDLHLIRLNSLCGVLQNENLQHSD